MWVRGSTSGPQATSHLMLLEAVPGEGDAAVDGRREGESGSEGGKRGQH